MTQEINDLVEKENILVTSVLSGNRNFEGYYQVTLD